MWIILTACLLCMPEGKLKIFPRIVFHAGNTADAITTINALNNSNVEEGNKLIYGSHPSDARVIATKAGVGILTDYYLRHLAKKHPKLANGIALGAGIGLSGIAIHNHNQRGK